MYFFREFLFLPLPCGCIAECEDLVVTHVDGCDYVECSWCATTVARVEMKNWLASECSPLVYIQNPAPDLLRVKGRLLEVVGQHGCGAPIVRERGAREAFHLDIATGDDVVQLLD